MIENYITNDWQTMSQIRRRYRDNDEPKSKRAIRSQIEKFNKDYYDTYSDFNKMIIYSSKGYKLTSDSKEILACMNRHMKLAIVHFKCHNKIAKAMGIKINYKMLFDEELAGDSELTVEGER